MGKRSEQEPEAIRLYAEGKEIPQISIELGVSENSLRVWKKRAGTEWDEARVACRKGMVGPETMEDIGARMRRSREITDRVSADLKAQGELGAMINIGLRTMMYDVMNQMATTDILDADQMKATMGQMNQLALMLNRAETAAERNRKTAEEIRKQAIEDAVTEVKKKAHDGTFQFDPEAVEYIAGALYGLKI